MKKFLTSSLVALAIAGTAVPADAFSFSDLMGHAKKAVSTVAKHVGPILKDPKTQALIKAGGAAAIAGGAAAYAAHKNGGTLIGSLKTGVMAGGAAGMAAHAAGKQGAVEAGGEEATATAE